MTAGPETKLIRIGRDQKPVAVIDNFFSDVDTLIEVAKDSTFVAARNLYPGVRAPIPDFYWSSRQLQVLAAAIEDAFGLRGKFNIIDASFSMVTTPREDLKIGQRLPHVDGFNPNQIALVHYLSPDVGSGTAFYRHRSTGIEVLNEDLRQVYFRQVDLELNQYRLPPPDYINGDTHMFERIAEVAGVFNRALLYRGNQLHSGAIAPETPLCSDPSQGRLTVTAFATIVQP